MIHMGSYFTVTLHSEFFRLQVVVASVFQLGSRRFISNDDSVRMKLQRAGGATRRDRTFDAIRHCICLPLACRQENTPLRFKNCPHAHREGIARHAFGCTPIDPISVSSVRTTKRVRDANDELGSLNPMWPFLPMPKIWSSIPPAFLISASYHWQYKSISSSGTLDFGMNMCSLGTLTCS